MSNNIISKCRDGVRTIVLNRPEKKNAMSSQMYRTITDILTKDAVDDKIVVTIITGSGIFFTSGTELSLQSPESPTENLNNVKNLITAIINFPKLLIAVVNGPAVGIGATISGLCDIVYASDRAFFDTPFVNLGLCAEAASSFTFPFILGRSKASEVLLLNHKLTAQEALQFGFVSSVIPHFALEGFINDLYRFGDLPVNTLKRSKKLIMANLIPVLIKSVERETAELEECIESDEFSESLLKFLNRRSKL